MTNDEWECRFKAQVVKRLTASEDPWPMAHAQDAAEATYLNAVPEEIRDGYEEDPEGAADEELSYWDDDGD